MAADNSAPTAAASGSRRDRLREQLVGDARAVAREILVSAGPTGLTVAAVARRLGVSPPALYRYFDGKDGLVRAVYDDLVTDLIAFVRAAMDRQDPADLDSRLHAGATAVFTWSLENPGAFELLMGAAYPAAAESQGEIPRALIRELGALFARPFEELSRRGRLADVPTEEEIAPELRSQLTRYARTIGTDLPLGAVKLLFVCWRQLYGVLSMAVNGHLAYAFGDDGYQAVYEDMVADLLRRVGTRSG